MATFLFALAAVHATDAVPSTPAGQSRAAPSFPAAAAAIPGSGTSTASSYLQRVCDPISFGAMPNSKRDNTAAIQHAIDQCTRAGGGTVPLHAGVYQSGPVRLGSHITLQLEDGSHLTVIQSPLRAGPGVASTSIKSAPSTQPPLAAHIGIPVSALITANNVHDVAILGSGTVDGPVQESSERSVRAAAHSQHHEKHAPGQNAVPEWLIDFTHVKHARIGAILASNLFKGALMLRDSADIRVTGMRIVDGTDLGGVKEQRVASRAKNNGLHEKSIDGADGVDVVSSQSIVLSGLDVNTQGDDVVIASGAPGAVASPPHDAPFSLTSNAISTLPPSSDITLRDAAIRHGQGVAVICDTANGIEGVHISNIHFIGTQAGLRIKSTREQGADIGDIDARQLRMDDVGTPIRISDYANGEGQAMLPTQGDDAARSLTPRTPRIHDISISDLVARGAQDAGFIVGLPEAPITRLVLRRIDIEASDGLILRNVHGTREGIRIVATSPALQLEANTALTHGHRVD